MARASLAPPYTEGPAIIPGPTSTPGSVRSTDVAEICAHRNGGGNAVVERSKGEG